jgi:two-component system phosphate regulon sensor histidine kinase PhoR
MAGRGWKVHAGRLLLAVFGLVLLGWLTGHPLRIGAIALLAWVVWHCVNLWRLLHWLQSPGAEVPESYGLWSEIFERTALLDKENQRQKERYQAMIAEFRQLTDAFPDATLVVDADQSITWFNSATTRLLGLQAPQDLGKPVTNLLRGPDFADWLAVQHELRSPLEMASPRDDTVWLSVAAIPFQEGQRLLILRDHTEVHNVEQIRRDFIANVSHELRTPLTVLQGYLELLQERADPDVVEAVARMQAQTRQMQELLDDLLELSRLQSDEIEGEEERVDVPALLAQLREQAEELSRGRHQIEFRADDRLWLSGIANDLESAFGNLIANAIKYTPEGGTISVTWEDSEDGPCLIVSDTGIGVPARDLPRLTERFYRVGSDRARKTGGTGLGLAIVKHVMNAHQARLRIESELGAGSTFTCAFPAGRRRGASDEL